MVFPIAGTRAACFPGRRARMLLLELARHLARPMLSRGGRADIGEGNRQCEGKQRASRYRCQNASAHRMTSAAVAKMMPSAAFARSRRVGSHRPAAGRKKQREAVDAALPEYRRLGLCATGDTLAVLGGRQPHDRGGVPSSTPVMLAMIVALKASANGRSRG